MVLCIRFQKFFHQYDLIVWHKVNSIYSYRLLFYVQKWKWCVACHQMLNILYARTMTISLFDSYKLGFLTFINKQVSSSANRIQKIVIVRVFLFCSKCIIYIFISVYKNYSYFTSSFVVFQKWNNAWHNNMYVVGWYQDRWSICLYNLILFCYWFWKRPNVSLWFISLVFNWIMFSEVRSKIFAISYVFKQWNCT